MHRHWRLRNLWLLLAAAIALVAWALTIRITHVDRAPQREIGIAIDERPAFQFERLPVSVSALQQARHRFPEVALTGREHLLLLATPGTRSLTISGIDPSGVTCGALERIQGDTAAIEAAGDERIALAPIDTRVSPGSIFIPISDAMRARAAATGRRTAILCRFAHAVATAPTFTERAVTMHVQTGTGGAVMLDVSALEDVDDLRFSGGIQVPLGGDRTRLTFRDDDVVSAEWVDVAASEQRDIVLVIIGALSAIAAAMAIEAIRPIVETQNEKRRAKE